VNTSGSPEVGVTQTITPILRLGVKGSSSPSTWATARFFSQPPAHFPVSSCSIPSSHFNKFGVGATHDSAMSSRAGGRQTMSDLKLRRLIEHNQRLREDLARPRMKVSEASTSLIRYCKATKDHLVPSVWGPVGRADDPYGQQTAGGCSCCSIQ